MNNAITVPNKIFFSQDEKYLSEVVIEPLYPGYGMTIGNSLRRVLLSSLPGAAVTAVKIKGVDHEFSSVSGVTEDVVDIILNLKKIRFRFNTDEPQVRLTLKSKGQKEVTAGDIKSDSRVEVANPELVIATLDGKSTEMNMELVVEQGRGYVPVEMRDGEKLEIGMIAVDAVFTPMRNVNFRVENVRVGQITNFDKLTLTMETDGTISGREALDQASRILVDHFTLLKTDNLDGRGENAAEISVPDERTETLVTETEAPPSDLVNLGLSKRAFNALIKNNIRTVAELRTIGADALQGLEGLGQKSIDEIREAISNLPEV